MKQHILVSAVALAMLALSGCSSTGTTGPSASATTPIADQRLAVSDFKRQGIRIGYTLGGEIDFIETTGYAPVWGASQNAAQQAFRVAELEAKKSLNDFINKESITSTVSVRMISQNLESAKDQRTNNFSTNRTGRGEDELVALDDPVQQAENKETRQEENTAVRNDALKIASRVSTTITTQNRGILAGLYLVEGRVINDGKNVQVVYRWDRKSNAGRQQLRNLMSQ
jgi:hypothetical protein